MNLFFIDRKISALADKNSNVLKTVKAEILACSNGREVFDPELADAIIIQENDSFKNFNYIIDLQEDQIISAYPQKVFTINTDDSATGLLRGIYTCLPKSRINDDFYRSVPYMEFPNELVCATGFKEFTSGYLASWRGNTKSNFIRPKMVELFNPENRCEMEHTDSWMDHDRDEKEKYISLMQNSKFSLCPAGWAPATYRIYESMALGRCPVIIADSFVLPAGPNWNEFALFYPQSKIDHLLSFLHQHEHLAGKYGRNAYKAWKKYFSPDNIKTYYAESLISLIKATPKVSKADEIARWNSMELFWSNRWTLPQRVINKIKQQRKAFNKNSIGR